MVSDVFLFPGDQRGVQHGVDREVLFPPRQPRRRVVQPIPTARPSPVAVTPALNVSPLPHLRTAMVLRTSDGRVMLRSRMGWKADLTAVDTARKGLSAATRSTGSALTYVASERPGPGNREQGKWRADLDAAHSLPRFYDELAA